MCRQGASRAAVVRRLGEIPDLSQGSGHQTGMVLVSPRARALGSGSGANGSGLGPGMGSPANPQKP